MTLLEVSDLRTWFGTSGGSIRAVDGVSLQLEQGAALGIAGESGSGKSALVRSIMGLHPPNVARSDGTVVFDGVDLRTLTPSRLREYWGRRIGIVFQNPMTSLNPVVRIGRQVSEGIREILGVKHAEAEARAVELLRSVGIPDPERRMGHYPHQLSGGMRQRVAISIALSCDPDLLIADEPTTALDVTVQAQIMTLLHRLRSERRMALIIVSHDLGVLAGLADEIAVMYAGRIVEQGFKHELIESPRMPYTEALLRSSPRLDHRAGSRLPSIAGRPPIPSAEIVGCAFAPRCTRARDRCTVERPSLERSSPTHRYACWYPIASPADRSPSAVEQAR